MPHPRSTVAVLVVAIRALAALALLAGSASAQTVVFSNTITGTNPSANNPYTTGQSADANLSVTGIGRGSGISAASANDRYSAQSWNTTSLDTTAYFTWTLTPGAGHTLTLSSFVYTGQTSGSGPTSFALRSSADSFSTDLGSPSSTGTTVSLTSAAFQNLGTGVEFRLYGWNASGATGTFSVNDFSFSGSVTAVPEPSTYALLGGVAALGAVLWRRRRARGHA